MFNKHIESFVVTSNNKTILNDMAFHISYWKIFKRMAITSAGKGMER